MVYVIKRGAAEQRCSDFNYARFMFFTMMENCVTEGTMFSAYDDNSVLKEYIYCDVLNSIWCYNRVGGYSGKHTLMSKLYIDTVEKVIDGVSMIREYIEEYAEKKGYKIDKYDIDYLLMYWVENQAYDGALNIAVDIWESGDILYVRVFGDLIGALKRVNRGSEIIYVVNE